MAETKCGGCKFHRHFARIGKSRRLGQNISQNAVCQQVGQIIMHHTPLVMQRHQLTRGFETFGRITGLRVQLINRLVVQKHQRQMQLA